MSNFPIEKVFDLLAARRADARYLSQSYYSAGLWTPELFFGGAQVGMTTSVKSGYWWAFNTIIVGHARITLTAKGSSVGSATITGLPFTSDTNVQSGHMMASFYGAFAALGGSLFGRIPGSSKTIQIHASGAAAAVALTEANLTNTSTVDFWFIYNALPAECAITTVGGWIPLDA